MFFKMVWLTVGMFFLSSADMKYYTKATTLVSNKVGIFEATCRESISRRHPHLVSSNLSTNSARNSDIGVHVSKEHGWVPLDLADVEVLARVHTRGVKETGLERSLEASHRNALVCAAFVCWVRKGYTGGTGLASGGLVNVGGGVGGGLVGGGAEAAEADAVADEVLLRVDAEVVVADGTLGRID